MSESTDVRKIEVVGQQVVVEWSDGHESRYSARDLRINCSCAECVEEWTQRKLLDPVSVPTDIRAEDHLMVGRYAVQFLWSDTHSIGIYPFEMLRVLCPCDEHRAARE